MGDYDVVLQEALSEAARALGRDRGRRNESIAQRIRAIRSERDKALAEVERLREVLVAAGAKFHELDLPVYADACLDSPAPDEQGQAS